MSPIGRGPIPDIISIMAAHTLPFFRLFARTLRKHVGTEMPNYFASSAAVKSPRSHKARMPSSCFLVVFFLAPPITTAGPSGRQISLGALPNEVALNVR
jgi:hypothetical protein